MLYRAERWLVKNFIQKIKLCRSECFERDVLWDTRRDDIKNEDIRDKVALALIVD